MTLLKIVLGPYGSKSTSPTVYINSSGFTSHQSTNNIILLGRGFKNWIYNILSFYIPLCIYIKKYLKKDVIFKDKYFTI